MSHQQIIEQTSKLLARLPEDKAQTVLDFANFLTQQRWAALPLVEDPLPDTETEEEFRADVTAIARHTRAFDWLHDEPDLYTDDDLLERYK